MDTPHCHMSEMPTTRQSDFPESNFWTFFGKVDSPIGHCSRLLATWRFHAN